VDFSDVESSTDLSKGLQLLDAVLRDRGLALDPPSTAPGLDEDELRSWEEANADRIRLSNDVRTLWGWHAGSTSPWLRYQLFTPDEALADTEEQRLLDGDIYRFDRDWLVIGIFDGWRLAVDCRQEASPSPVFSVEPEHPFRWPMLGAVAYLFRFWAFCLAEGIYEVHPGSPQSRPGLGVVLEKTDVLRMSPYRDFL
jgi:hypothetical protein